MARQNGRGGGTATQEKSEKRDPPVWSRKIWTGSANVEAAVFEKIVNEGGQGEFVAMNTTLRRTWKDGEGVYQSSSSFRQEDLGALLLLVQQAAAFVTDALNKRE